MLRRHAPRAAALALLAAICATFLAPPDIAQAKAKDDRAANPVIELLPPDGWERGPINIYLNRNRGFSVPYDNETVTATLFQFNRGLDHVPSDPEHELIQEELEDAANAIQQLVDLGKWESAERLSTELIPLGESEQHAQWTRFELVHRGTTLVSDTFVWPKDNHFLKLRLTVPKADYPHQQPSIDALLTRLGNASQATD